MPDYKIGTNSSDAVQIYPKWNFTSGKKQYRSDQVTKTGKTYTYKFGDIFKANIEIEWVNSSDASNINDWWEDRDELLLFEIDSVTTVNSVLIMNNETPMQQYQEPYVDYYRGRIELEGY